MSRKRLLEFRAKTILSSQLGSSYSGLSLQMDSKTWKLQIAGLSADTSYVAKVDQGVKGRFKKGLVKLDYTKSQLPAVCLELVAAGYDHILVEPFAVHQQAEERYVSLQRTRQGLLLSYSRHGGIDIEGHPESVQSGLFTTATVRKAARALGVTNDFLQQLQMAFDDNHFTFLEINPLIVSADGTHILDAAVEVDDEAEFFAGGNWLASDLRSARSLNAQERAVVELNDTSQASMSLESINQSGSIFLLLSGGGASIVVADEVYRLGKGTELGNYGEYSGNPSAEETYRYTQQIIELMLASAARRKVLIIAGGVANFTDIRLTFKGIIRALQESETKLQAAGVKIFVRRGGPHEQEGLEHMKSYLDGAGLTGAVCGPEVGLSDIAGLAVAALEDS